MPRILIHVGPHKTGTTYLQLVFAAVRQRLLQRGVVYPADWSASDTTPSHHKIFRHIRDRNVGCLKQQFDKIVQAGADCVLISAEDINILQKEELESLRLIVQGHPVTVIFYCRRWSELLPSLWQERVKHGFDETFAEFFSQNMRAPHNSSLLNFALSLDKYASVFGKANVRIVSYSNLSDENQDLASHFFDTFLPEHRSVLDDLPPIANLRPNQSFPTLDIEFIRVLNSFRATNAGKRDAALRDWYMRGRGRFDLTEVISAMKLNVQELLFSDSSSATGYIQEAIFKAYGENLVAPANHGAFFAARTNRIEFVQPRYLTHRSVFGKLEQVYAAFVEGDSSDAAIR